MHVSPNKPSNSLGLSYTCPCLCLCNSNTRLSNVFREFSRGIKAESDPVAVLISWRQKRTRGHSSPTTPSCTIGDAAVEQTRQAAIAHLTSRDLHAFLFGASNDYRPLPSVTLNTPGAVVAPRTGKRQRAENPPLNETPSGALDPGPHFCRGGGVGIVGDGHANGYLKCFPTNVTERSEAAATAAGDGGGWCLLQKFVGSAGSKSSTLRWATSMQAVLQLVGKHNPAPISWQPLGRHDSR